MVRIKYYELFSRGLLDIVATHFLFNNSPNLIFMDEGNSVVK